MEGAGQRSMKAGAYRCTQQLSRSYNIGTLSFVYKL